MDFGDYLNQLLGGDMNQYHTVPLNMNTLTSYLQGQQSRQAGTAGQGAAGLAYSQGLNPFGYINRARSDVYNHFADQFSRIPSQVFQSQLESNQADWARLAQLLGMKFQQEQSGFNFFRDVLPGLIGAGGTIGAAALGGRH